MEIDKNTTCLLSKKDYKDIDDCIIEVASESNLYNTEVSRILEKARQSLTRKVQQAFELGLKHQLNSHGDY